MNKIIGPVSLSKEPKMCNVHQQISTLAVSSSIFDLFAMSMSKITQSRTDVKEHDKKSKVLIQKTIAQIFFI